MSASPNVTIGGTAGEDEWRVSHIRCQSVNGECEINNTPYEDFTHTHTRPDSKQIWLSLTSRQGTDCKQFTGSPKKRDFKDFILVPYFSSLFSQAVVIKKVHVNQLFLLSYLFPDESVLAVSPCHGAENMCEKRCAVQYLWVCQIRVEALIFLIHLVSPWDSVSLTEVWLRSWHCEKLQNLLTLASGEMQLFYHLMRRGERPCSFIRQIITGVSYPVCVDVVLSDIELQSAVP